MEINGNIRLAGIDLDGTLLNDDKLLCVGAADTIKKAYENGIHIVPITGRPLLGIPKCVTELDEVEYIISSNGAQINDMKNKKALYTCTISHGRSLEIMRLLRELDLVFEPFTEGFGFTEKHIYNKYLHQYIGTVLEEYIRSSRRIVKRIEDLYEGNDRVTDEYFVHAGDVEKRKKLLKELDKAEDLQYCVLNDTFVEITAKGCDKGESLEKLCKHLGVDIKDTIAFGDGENDLLFLEKAGVAVAMENAHPAVKEKADIIAKSNNDNGVCEILEKLI